MQRRRSRRPRLSMGGLPARGSGGARASVGGSQGLHQPPGSIRSGVRRRRPLCARPRSAAQQGGMAHRSAARRLRTHRARRGGSDRVVSLDRRMHRAGEIGSRVLRGGDNTSCVCATSKGQLIPSSPSSSSSSWFGPRTIRLMVPAASMKGTRKSCMCHGRPSSGPRRAGDLGEAVQAAGEQAG